MPDSPSFLDKFSLGFKDLWDNHKLFLIIFGVLIVIYKFREVLIEILVSSGKKILEDTKKEDQKLAAEENAAKTQADDLVKKAQEAPSKDKPSDDDWYK